MGSTSNGTVRPELIADDREILIALQSLPDYSPRHESVSLANLQQLDASLRFAEQNEVLTREAHAAAREQLTVARRAFHRATLIAKAEITLQYGDDSPALRVIRRIRRSERRRPTRRATPA